jgi:hypothetical protein
MRRQKPFLPPFLPHFTHRNLEAIMTQNAQPLAHHATEPTKRQSQMDYILVDGSGSMQDKWWDTLDAIEAYVQGVKAANIQSHIILHSFDDVALELLHRDGPIENWVPLRQSPIGAYWGGTPLYDAISLMARKLRDLDPPRASIVIVTDGAENASKSTDLTQAKALLDWMRAKGWQITFIGADFSNSRQARALGANESSAIGVEKRRLTDATSALAKKRARYGLYGEAMHYSDDEKQQFGGYLNKPDENDDRNAP